MAETDSGRAPERSIPPVQRARRLRRRLMVPLHARSGLLIGRTDGKGKTAYFEHDAVGRPIVARYPGVQTVYHAYDAAGSMTQMQDKSGLRSPPYGGRRRLGRDLLDLRRDGTPDLPS